MKGIMKSVAVLVLTIVFLAVVTGCSGTGNTGNQMNNNESGNESTIVENPNETGEPEAADGETVGTMSEVLKEYSAQAALDVAATPESTSNSLVNMGNTARIARVMEQMAKGEETTVAYIGGSITEGYLVNSKQNYPVKVTEYLRDYFDNEAITTVNAGLSGTSSTIGLLRLQKDVLSQSPDLVVIEYAVNDAQSDMDKMMYESLVKECLTLESSPAVIILITVTESGYTCEEQMTKIGLAYELPIINVKQTLFQEIDEGTMEWSQYSVDDVHPSGDGHTMIKDYFVYYFNTVLANGLVDPEPEYADMKAYGAAYLGMNFYNNETLYPAELGGFVEGNSNVAHFPKGWIWSKEDKGSMKFTMTGRNLFLLYKENNSDNMGTVEVYIDGRLEKTVQADSPDGWDNPEVVTLLNEVSEGEHEVEIKVTSDTIDKNFHILGLGTTGELRSVERIDAQELPYTERAILNEGNTSRLEALIQRAKAGEKLTIGFIGGSITMGSGASSPGNCYAKLVYDWWCKSFPNSEFVYVNAGIGATTSQFACARLENDLLQYEPDFVIVEFSVNDESGEAYKDSYESLVRRILEAENNPAVMILNMVQYNNGGNVQTMHNLIAATYELPIVSMKESIYQDILSGKLTAADVSGDNLHPNDKGHAYGAEIVTNYLQLVAEGTITHPEPYELPETLSNLTYINAARYDNRNSEPFLNGFTADTKVQSTITDIFKNGYTAKKVGDSITFEVEGSGIALQYRKTNKLNAPKAIAIIDGDESNAVELDGNYPSGWGDWLYLDTIYSNLADSGAHTVEICITKAGTNEFYLVSVITTKK